MFSTSKLRSLDNTCCSVNRFKADCKYLSHQSKTDKQNNMKRLKSRKERSQKKGSGKGASKSRSHHHHCCRQSNTDMAHFHNFCHSSCHCPSRRGARFPNVVPATQEPSIITDSRLIGHHGLFNHEVKSIDIERLLSGQRKLDKKGQQVQEKNNAISHLPSTSHITSPFSINGFLGADTDDVMPFDKRADPTTKAHDDCLEKEKIISQGSDVTPGQRPQQQIDVSTGSFKSIFSSKHSSLDGEKTNPVMSEKGRESQLTPTADRENVKTLNKDVKGHMISTLEQRIPKNQASRVHQTQASDLSPSPFQLSNSHSFDIEHKRQDPDCVSKSVSAVAADLCDCLQFPIPRRRNLVAESRGVLLKALQKRHGPLLQENLLQVQRSLSFGTEHTKEVQDQEPTMREEDELLPTDALTTTFQANTTSQPFFGPLKTTSFKMKRSKHFNWKSRPQLHQKLDQTAEWVTRPVKASIGFLDDILKPTCSPQFCMDIKPSGVTAIDHLFAPTPTSCWGEKASASQHLEDRFNRPKSKEAVMFGSFENDFMNHTRAVPERSSEFCDSKTQSFISQKQDPFESNRYSFAPAVSAHIHRPQQSNLFQPFCQFSHPPNCPPLRSHYTDMMHYPPSHMLERDQARPFSSFSSPEHWSFPRMRLY